MREIILAGITVRIRRYVEYGNTYTKLEVVIDANGQTIEKRKVLRQNDMESLFDTVWDIAGEEIKNFIQEKIE